MTEDLDWQSRLAELRTTIDRIDQRILQLLNERMAMVTEIGRIKQEAGRAPFDPGREEVVYAMLCAANTGPLSETSLRAVYREILAASRELQERVAAP